MAQDRREQSSDDRTAPGAGTAGGVDPLATRRRRDALRVLATHRLAAHLDSGATRVRMPVDRLVDAVAERERLYPGTDVDDRDDHRRSVAASVRFDHLPALESAGLLTYDAGEERVSYTGDPAVEAELHLAE